MRKALVIDMDDRSLTPWHGCPSNVATIAELLKTHGDGKPNFDVTLRSSSREELTTALVEAAVFEFFWEAKNLALLYVAGMGATHPAPLALDHILDFAAQSKATDKIIMLDSCWRGETFESSCQGGDAQELPPGVSVLAGGQPTASSVETPESGAFSSLVARALEGGAADLRGKVTPGGMYAYVDHALGAGDYRPFYRTSAARFTSVRAVSAPEMQATLAKLLELFPSPQSVHALDPSYEPTNTSKQVGERSRAPEADPAHVAIMEELHKLAILGLVVPVGEEHMSLAAMNSKCCRLTALGLYYWRLVKEGLLYA